MPSTYTLNNGIELIATGEQSGTWGDTTNTNMSLLDTALDGQVTVTLASAGTSGSPNTLPISDGAASDGRNRMVIFNDGADLGATAYVQLTPNDAEKIVYIRNALSGSRSIIVFQGTYNASNDYEIPAGSTAVVYFNGGGTGAVAANVFNNAHFDALNIVGAAAVGTTLTVGTSLNIASSTTVDGVLDEDNMASDSATKLATQQSIKAYVDSQVTAQDLDFAGDSGTGAVDLDSQTFTISGTANEIETSASGQTLTVGLPDNVTITGDLTVDTNTLFVDSSTNKVSIGTTSSDGTLHVHTGSAGVVTAAAAADDLVIENSNAAGLSLLFDDTSTNSYGVIYWGNETDGNADGRIEYFGSTYVTAGDRQAMLFRAAAVERLRLQGTAVVINETGSDTDFRVESDTNTHALFVDAGNSRVGINTTPSYTVHALSAQSDAFLFSSSHATTTNFYINNTNATTNNTANLYFSPANAVAGAYIEAKALEDFSVVANRSASLDFVTRQDGNWHSRLNLSDTATVFNENGRDTDFRVESDSVANMLLVDAGNNRVGVGTGNPQYTFVVSNSGAEGLEISAGGISANRQNIISYNRSTSAYNSLWIDSLEIVMQPPGGGGGSVNIGDSDTNIAKLNVKGEVNGRIARLRSDDNYQGFDLSGETTYGNGTVAITPSTIPGSGVANMWTHFATAGTGPGYTIHNVRIDGELETDRSATFNQGGNDFDFRVESDANSHMLFVDAGNNQVAVGTSGVNSGFMFGVQGSVTVGDRDNNIASGGHALELSGASLNDTIADYGSYGALRFYATASYTGSAKRALITNGYRTNQLGFLIGDVDPSSEPSVADRGNPANAIVPLSIEYNGPVVVNQEGDSGVDFRVESDNNSQALLVDAGSNFVAMGNTTKVPVSGFADQHGFGFDAQTGATQIASDGIPLELGRTTTGGANGLFIQMRQQSNVVGVIGNYNGVPYIGYGAGTGGGIMFNGQSIEPTALGATRSDGTNDIGSVNYRWQDAYLSGAIYLGGTTAANALDDYEEGTWTPVLTAVSGTKTWSYSAQRGTYTKVGNLVTIFFNIQLSSNGSGTDGNARITGLPFTMETDTSLVAVYAFFWKQLVETGDVALMGQIPSSGNYINLLDGSSNYPDIAPISTSVLANDRRIRGTMQYRV